MRIEREALYTIDEIAEMFGMGRRTAQRMVYTGKVPARKLANRLVIRGEDLLDNLPSYAQRREQRDSRRNLLEDSVPAAQANR
jgi:AraC-like DNA-binding protein